MGQNLEQYPNKRRFPRVHGPFFGFFETPQAPVLVYDLNLGGGFVNFGGEQPSIAAFLLGVALPREGMITVHAETVYQDKSGVAVRFVDVDGDTLQRLTRSIDAMLLLPPSTKRPS